MMEGRGPANSTEGVAASESGGFPGRHIGPGPREQEQMVHSLGAERLGELIEETVPSTIRSRRELRYREAVSERDLLGELEEISRQNERMSSFLGTGYASCITPPVIQRNILENPAWYTQYTPYQSEIAQGRLEALLTFQTVVCDLTALELANASLLDEGTAAAEAMAMMKRQQVKNHSRAFFLSSACHPQTKAVLRTRARPLQIEIFEGNHESFDFGAHPVFGCLLQYPASDGALCDYREFCSCAHENGALVAVAAELLALPLLTPPGEFGADVAVGSAQRFGMPMGYGGPHAAYLAAREEFRRQVPGRIIGVSRDDMGRRALRMALQTREQHIRRETATSNICTAQVLPAVVASFYAVYHGPEGLRAIAARIHHISAWLAGVAQQLGYRLVHRQFFDTIRLQAGSSVIAAAVDAARRRRIELRRLDGENICITLDETTGPGDADGLRAVLAEACGSELSTEGAPEPGCEPPTWDPSLLRESPYLTHPVFHSYRSETELLRYMRRLDARDLSLTTSMIPLGSCTMKLNATAEMMPITWPAFADVHPFSPVEKNLGYQRIFTDLEEMLCDITGLAAVSLQPNAGSQGEYAGLLVISRYHETRGGGRREVCLIPASAHGTNPASAALAGMTVVVVACDAEGNIDLEDLRAKADAHADRLGALMVTYPSTHGVFEEGIGEICEVVHDRGGQVYMDGANMNAMVGLCRPGDLGVDVCHLNLHKTFCIPHGGGGPGMGPIAVAAHLRDFLPGHPIIPVGGANAIGPVASAPWSSALILLISWAYLRLMGSSGLRDATEVAMLNANYVAARLDPHFPVLYRGSGGRVAHEAILDLRSFRSVGIEVDDVAKRLMDYGFHAPTVHFPVPGTMMVEPTESESKAELDRFCDAMIAIRTEIAEIEAGKADPLDNPLKNAPHTLDMILDEDWNHPYSRERACRPAPWTKNHKFWPSVARVDNAGGDRNLVCTCPPVESYAGPEPGVP